MSKYSINLLQVPNQSLSCNLTDDENNTYAVDIDLRTLSDGNMVANISIDGEMIISSVMCCNKMPLIPSNMINGNIYFEDEFDNTDPVYSGFNDKYKLIYDTEFRLG